MNYNNILSYLKSENLQIECKANPYINQEKRESLINLANQYKDLLISNIEQLNKEAQSTNHFSQDLLNWDKVCSFANVDNQKSLIFDFYQNEHNHENNTDNPQVYDKFMLEMSFVSKLEYNTIRLTTTINDFNFDKQLSNDEIQSQLTHMRLQHISGFESLSLIPNEMENHQNTEKEIGYQLHKLNNEMPLSQQETIDLLKNKTIPITESENIRQKIIELSNVLQNKINPNIEIVLQSQRNENDKHMSIQLAVKNNLTDSTNSLFTINKIPEIKDNVYFSPQTGLRLNSYNMLQFNEKLNQELLHVYLLNDRKSDLIQQQDSKLNQFVNQHFNLDLYHYNQTANQEIKNIVIKCPNFYDSHKSILKSKYPYPNSYFVLSLPNSKQFENDEQFYYSVEEPHVLQNTYENKLIKLLDMVKKHNKQNGLNIASYDNIYDNWNSELLIIEGKALFHKDGKPTKFKEFLDEIYDQFGINVGNHKTISNFNFKDEEFNSLIKNGLTFIYNSKNDDINNLILKQDNNENDIQINENRKSKLTF